MPVFTRAYANFARAISRATTNRSARGCTRRESGRSSSRESGAAPAAACDESCRTGTAADGSLAPGGSGGTGHARRDHYCYFKSGSRR